MAAITICSDFGAPKNKVWHGFHCLPIIMYKRGIWTIKKAACWRIDAFKLWCWRSLLWLQWTARRSNQSILKKINPEYSLEGVMLKLKLQYFGHLMWRTNPLEKILMLGKVWEQEKKGWQRMKWLDNTIDSMDMNLSKPWERAKDRKSWHAAIHGVAKSWVIQFSDWTVTKHSRHSRVIQY